MQLACAFYPPHRHHNPSPDPLQVCAADPVLCKGVSTRQLQVVSSGSGLPVIDLSQVCGVSSQACPRRQTALPKQRAIFVFVFCLCLFPLLNIKLEDSIRTLCKRHAMHAALLTWLQISAELAEAAAGADLVVLEGMGRSIETNLHARFRCGGAVGDPLHVCEPACI
jgi:hypothetical protein